MSEIKKQSCLVGSYNEVQVELRCLEFGWQVFRPTRQDGEIDLLVITPDRAIHGLQIRTANYANRGPHGGRKRLGVNLTRWNGEKYSPAVTHVIAVHGPRMWIFPAEECTGIKKLFRPIGSDREGAWHLIGPTLNEHRVGMATAR